MASDEKASSPKLVLTLPIASIRVCNSMHVGELIKCCTAAIPSILTAITLVHAYLCKIALMDSVIHPQNDGQKLRKKSRQALYYQ